MGLNVLRFYSARKKGVINVAISESDVITSPAPENNTQWHCSTTPTSVSFSTLKRQPVTFHLSEFMSGDLLPRPA